MKILGHLQDQRFTNHYHARQMSIIPTDPTKQHRNCASHVRFECCSIVNHQSTRTADPSCKRRVFYKTSFRYATAIFQSTMLQMVKSWVSQFSRQEVALFHNLVCINAVYVCQDIFDKMHSQQHFIHT